jgi:dTDP-4-dehydrorhamnose reductase
MNILVTGANGQLGNEMRVVSKNSKDHYFFSDITDQEGVETIHLDIPNKDEVQRWVEENDIKLIVNCAAYTNVDKAESDYEKAELLNATAVGYLADAVKQFEGTLIHVSTDYVFGGGNSRTPYKEDETASPTSVYGLTKLHGERKIVESECNYLIIRTAWLYSEFGKNFVKTMMSLTSTRKELKVVFDQVGTPTYAGDLASAIYNIIEKRQYDKQGIYHFSNEGVCSWFDFALKIAEMAGNTECKIRPCLSCEFPSPVTRPSYSVLDKAKIKETFEIDIPYWTESLKLCMERMIQI